jgi:hypothetical protein
MSQAANSGRRHPKPRRFRPGIENLEDRVVPANLPIVADVLTDTVGNTAGHFSLREAITQANKNPGPDIIRLLPGTYQITRTAAVADNTNERGDFDIALTSAAAQRDSLTIAGADNGGTTILGDPRSGSFGRERLFEVLGVGDVVFQNLTLRNAGNTQSVGGAVQAISANVTMRDTLVTGMFGLKGGAVNAENGNVTLIRTTMRGNNAFGNTNTPGDGGAINATSGTVQLLDNSLLQSNQAAANGGGVAAGSGAVQLINSIVDHNIAAREGGGVFARTGSVSLNHSHFARNTATGSGGGLSAHGGAVQIANHSVIDGVNTSLTGDGGGVYSFGGAVSVFDSTVNDNFAKTGGGGIASSGAALTRSTVIHNSTDGFGGGVSSDPFVTLVDSTVSGNTAATDAGGVNTVLKATLIRSTVDNNTAGGAGGGVKAGTVAITNSTISTNHANHGGGVFVTQGGDIVNATIVKNTAVFGGGVQSGTAPVRLKNTIVALNTITGSIGQDVDGTFTSLGHNLIGNPIGANNTFSSAKGDLLNVDPKLGALQDNGGPTRTHALLAGSRAIDQGDNAGAPATDQRGVARPRDGDGNGTLIVDIGAFEL